MLDSAGIKPYVKWLSGYFTHRGEAMDCPKITGRTHRIICPKCVKDYGDCRCDADVAHFGRLCPSCYKAEYFAKKSKEELT